jgi:hypothetical protein
MIRDGWSPYGCFAKAAHQQCLEHLRRRAAGLLERATRGAVRFPRKLAELLGDALTPQDRRDGGLLSPHALAVARGRWEKRLDRLLQWHLCHPGNRTPAGGRAQEVLSSILSTLAQRTRDALWFLPRVICLPVDQRPGFIHRLLPMPFN